MAHQQGYHHRDRRARRVTLFGRSPGLISHTGTALPLRMQALQEHTQAEVWEIIPGSTTAEPGLPRPDAGITAEHRNRPGIEVENDRSRSQTIVQEVEDTRRFLSVSTTSPGGLAPFFQVHRDCWWSSERALRYSKDASAYELPMIRGSLTNTR